MAEKLSKKGKQGSKESVADGSCRCGHDEALKRERQVDEAIEASVERFVRVNQDNIKRSSKDCIARASYGGGMADMLALIRGALGRWAVDQLLQELENWNNAGGPERSNELRINIPGGEGSGVTPEDAKELGEHIAKWIAERKGNGRRHSKDVMFA